MTNHLLWRSLDHVSFKLAETFSGDVYLPAELPLPLPVFGNAALRFGLHGFNHQTPQGPPGCLVPFRFSPHRCLASWGHLDISSGVGKARLLCTQQALAGVRHASCISHEKPGLLGLQSWLTS